MLIQIEDSSKFEYFELDAVKKRPNLRIFCGD
jgi:hypothetical protein